MYNFEKNKLNENKNNIGDDEMDEETKETNEKYALENDLEKYF